MPEVISARDNPGTLREFETVLILRPDTLQEGILELNKLIKDLIDTDEGRILLVENWGKRRLAYEIRKQLKGIYMYYQFLGHSQLIKEMERKFRLAESVIRYFTTRIDENVDPEARPGELSDEDFLAASATRPDEEELATGYVMTGTGEKIPVSRLGYEKKGESKPAEAPTEGAPTAAAPAEGATAEAAPAEAAPAEAAPAEAAPAEAAPDTAETAAPAPKAKPTAEAKTEAPAPKAEPTAEAKTEAQAPKAEPTAEAKTEAPAPKAKPTAEAKTEAPAPEAEAKTEAPTETPDAPGDKEEA